MSQKIICAFGAVLPILACPVSHFPKKSQSLFNGSVTIWQRRKPQFSVSLPLPPSCMVGSQMAGHQDLFISTIIHCAVCINLLEGISFSSPLQIASAKCHPKVHWARHTCTHFGLWRWRMFPWGSCCNLWTQSETIPWFWLPACDAVENRHRCTNTEIMWLLSLL